jgi:threonine/homoserine/homoserine lactone efflux protein
VKDLFSTILNGLIIGISIAAPVGPIGVLCIRRTLAQGKWVGFLSGLGAATADATYGALAALGFSFVVNSILSLQDWIKLLGGLLLIYIGCKTFFSPVSHASDSISTKHFAGSFFSTYLLTLTNPMTILFFAAIFSSLNVVDLTTQASSPLILVAGVFLGSSVWWLFLSQTTGLLKVWKNDKLLAWINRLSGATICLYGFISIIPAGVKLLAK